MTNRLGEIQTIKGFFRASLLVTCAILSRAPHSDLRGQSASEYQVKAVFLGNFAKFVEWPDAGGNPGPISICVLGEDPFDGTLDAAIKGKTVNGRGLAVKRSKRAEETVGCQIVFISTSERNRLQAILERLRRESALTVGETEGFAKSGGMINFTLEENRVHFEINMHAAERARLKISSKLLNLAKIVRDGADGGHH